MEILEPNGKRFEVALELFQSGEPLSFRGVSFALAPEGYLAVKVLRAGILRTRPSRRR